MILEGNAKLLVELKDIVTKDMGVFYNPVMAFQRDLTLAFLKVYFDEPIRVALPLAGSGVRGVRISQEILLAKLMMNDRSPSAVSLCKKHMLKNKKTVEEFQNKKRKEFISYSKQDANVFLRTCGIVDYIDIDPYGSSIPFLDSAIQAIHNGGVIALTNTDTAALCGSYPKVTRRRYGAIPFNRDSRHEVGIRILIKKAQEIAAVYDIALIPVLVMAKDHYARVFLKVKKGKISASTVIAEHGYCVSDEFDVLRRTTFLDGAIGPLYLGKLFDDELLSKLDFDQKTLELLKQDAMLDSVEQIYLPHEIAQKLKKDVPSYKKIFAKITEKGYLVGRSHFCKTAIRTDMPKEDFIALIKEF
jgi:tRNA (guanine26-N2/guanine27-N2)-dimethyltransferase